jgi:hypothetical protein
MNYWQRSAWTSITQEVEFPAALFFHKASVSTVVTVRCVSPSLRIREEAAHCALLRVLFFGIILYYLKNKSLENIFWLVVITSDCTTLTMLRHLLGQSTQDCILLLQVCCSLRCLPS